MRWARAASSRTMACAGLAVAATTFAAPSASALDDTSTLTSVMSLFGVGSDEQQEKIVYRERSKLVLPPSGRGLPDPQSRDGARPESWPVDQEVARRRGGETPAPRVSLDDNPNDPSAAKRAPTKCLSATSDGHCTLVTDADEPWLGGGGAKTRGASEASTRAYLVDPPAAFRQRVAGGKGVPDSEKSSDWWNPGALIGRVFGD